jgi:hypothetical protein
VGVSWNKHQALINNRLLSKNFQHQHGIFTCYIFAAGFSLAIFIAICP